MASTKFHVPAKQAIQVATLTRAGMAYVVVLGAGTAQIGSEERSLRAYAQGIPFDSNTPTGTVLWWQGPMFIFSDTDLDVLVDVPQASPGYSLEEMRQRGVI